MAHSTADRMARVDSILEDLSTALKLLAENAPSGNPKGYIKKKDGGLVHSSGKKANKKFANNTTFKSSPHDALLHTDGNKEGTRARLSKDNFAFHGSKDALAKDPRKKWFPVSSELGWASAAGSLRQAYERAGKDGREKVMSKVKQTTFTGADGQPIEPGTIDPMGKLKGERPECGDGKSDHPIHKHVRFMRRDASELEQGTSDRAKRIGPDAAKKEASQLRAAADHHAHQAYRLCKNHGAGGANEYETKFSPADEKHHKYHAPVEAPWHSIKPSRAGQRAVEGKFKSQVGTMLNRGAKSATRFSKSRAK